MENITYPLKRCVCVFVVALNTDCYQCISVQNQFVKARNDEGICASSYAEQFVQNTGPAWQDGTWKHLCDAIESRMVEPCTDRYLRLQPLVDLLHNLERALTSVRTYNGGGDKLFCTTCLGNVII